MHKQKQMNMETTSDAPAVETVPNSDQQKNPNAELKKEDAAVETKNVSPSSQQSLVDVAAAASEQTAQQPKEPMTVSGAPTEDGSAGADEDIEEDVEDEEDALFTSLEKEQEKEEMEHPHEQPKDYHVAPKLLQQALEKGEVKADDSEEESDKEKGGGVGVVATGASAIDKKVAAVASAVASDKAGAVPAAAVPATEAGGGESSKAGGVEGSAEHHVHQRVRGLHKVCFFFVCFACLLAISLYHGNDKKVPNSKAARVCVERGSGESKMSAEGLNESILRNQI